MHPWAAPEAVPHPRELALGNTVLAAVGWARAIPWRKITRISRPLSGLGAQATCVALVAGLSQSVHAVELRAETLKAFEQYADLADAEFERRLQGALPFLWSMETEARAAILQLGDIAVEAALNAERRAVRGGLVHDWTAAVLIPGAEVEHVVRIVNAYNTHAETYAPLVLRSRILERDGERLRVSMRMLRKNVFKVVLDTELLAEYRRLDARRWWGRSYTTRIREVTRPGTERESLKPVGNDRGFMWRLRTYWRFAQTETGVIAEYRSVTLTRSIPKALRRMLSPLLNAFPRQSLRTVLRITREAALEDAP